MKRHIHIEGGPFNGAQLFGNFSDSEFRLEYHGKLIAEVKGKALSMHTRYNAVLLKDDSAYEALTALILVDLMIQKHEARAVFIHLLYELMVKLTLKLK